MFFLLVNGAKLLWLQIGAFGMFHWKFEHFKIQIRKLPVPCRPLKKLCTSGAKTIFLSLSIQAQMCIVTIPSPLPPITVHPIDLTLVCLNSGVISTFQIWRVWADKEHFFFTFLFVHCCYDFYSYYFRLSLSQPGLGCKFLPHLNLCFWTLWFSHSSRSVSLFIIKYFSLPLCFPLSLDIPVKGAILFTYPLKFVHFWCKINLWRNVVMRMSSYCNIWNV